MSSGRNFFVALGLATAATALNAATHPQPVRRGVDAQQPPVQYVRPETIPALNPFIGRQPMGNLSKQEMAECGNLRAQIPDHIRPLFDNAMVSYDGQTGKPRDRTQRMDAWEKLGFALRDYPEVDGKVREYQQQHRDLIDGAMGIPDINGRIQRRADAIQVNRTLDPNVPTIQAPEQTPDAQPHRTRGFSAVPMSTSPAAVIYSDGRVRPNWAAQYGQPSPAMIQPAGYPAAMPQRQQLGFWDSFRANWDRNVDRVIHGTQNKVIHDIRLGRDPSDSLGRMAGAIVLGGVTHAAGGGRGPTGPIAAPPLPAAAAPAPATAVAPPPAAAAPVTPVAPAASTTAPPAAAAEPTPPQEPAEIDPLSRSQSFPVHPNGPRGEREEILQQFRQNTEGFQRVDPTEGRPPTPTSEMVGIHGRDTYERAQAEFKRRGIDVDLTSQFAVAASGKPPSEPQMAVSPVVAQVDPQQQKQSIGGMNMA